MSGNLLVLSGHDFRSDRRTGVHFVTEAAKTYFSKRSFFSLVYSFLSKMKGDPRALLGDRVNKWETHDGVKSYLWDTGLHPFNLKIPIVQQAMAYLYKLYAVLPCRQLDQAIESADVVMLESGLAPMFIPRIRAVSPTTRIIYFASDLLETIGVHPVVERTLQKNLARVDLIRIPARAIAPAFQSQSAKVRHAPHGVSVDQLTQPMVSPYRGTRRTICSAGSMLFDPSYFSAVAPLFDDVDFYIIGSGYKGDLGENVKLLDEMTVRRDVALCPLQRRGRRALSRIHGVFLSRRNQPQAAPGLLLRDTVHLPAFRGRRRSAPAWLYGGQRRERDRGDEGGAGYGARSGHAECADLGSRRRTAFRVMPAE